jgi:hypothetical protein
VSTIYSLLTVFILSNVTCNIVVPTATSSDTEPVMFVVNRGALLSTSVRVIITVLKEDLGSVPPGETIKRVKGVLENQ